jgi:antitoxin component of MazEF toxin-antitoxin module
LIGKPGVEIMQKDVIGVANLFKQGGSLRLILPKRVVRKLGLDDRHFGDDDDVTLVFVESENGILIQPFEKYIVEFSDSQERAKMANP